MSSFSSNNIFLFTIGRMNPPTPGHVQLISVMMEKAIELGLKNIYILLSSTIDNEKNPLECEEKRRFLYGNGINAAKDIVFQKWDNKIKEQTQNQDKEKLMSELNGLNLLNVEIICFNDETDSEYGSHPIMSKIRFILDKFFNYNSNKLNNNKDIKAILVIGEDRGNSYNFIKDALNNYNPPIDVTIDVVERPEGAISATLIRQLALSNDPLDTEKFKNYMSSMNVSDEESNYILNEIRGNIVIKEPKKRKVGSGGSKKKRNTNSRRRINTKKINHKNTKRHRKKSNKHIKRIHKY